MKTSEIHISYQELWYKFTKGDMLSFRKIYADFYQDFYNFGLLFLEKNDVENSIQDMFLYILQKRQSLSNVKNVRAYLFTCFRHQLSKTAKQHKMKFVQMPELPVLEKKENFLTEIITVLLAKLSPREKEVVQLKFYKNYKNKEIANKLGVEYQTVRNTLQNAVNKMRLHALRLEV